MWNIARTHPDADYVLAENDENGSDGKNEKRAHSVASDINLAHPIKIADCFRLARHGHKNLRQAGHEFLSIVDNAGADVEASDGDGGHHRPEQPFVGANAHARGDHYKKC